MLRFILTLMACFAMHTSHCIDPNRTKAHERAIQLIETRNAWLDRLRGEWAPFNTEELRDFILSIGDEPLSTMPRADLIMLFVSLEGQLGYIQRKAAFEASTLREGRTLIEDGNYVCRICEPEDIEARLTHLNEVVDANLLDTLREVGNRHGITPEERLDGYRFIIRHTFNQVIRLHDGAELLGRLHESFLLNSFPGIHLVWEAIQAELRRPDLE